MTCFAKLVGAALVALVLASPASARPWWVMERAAPTEVMERATPTHPLPKGCLVGHGLYTSPAFLFERMKSQGDPTVRIEEEKDGEVYVYYTEHYSHVYFRFFRTKEACEAAVQAARNKAAEEAKKLDKYR
jgi:hypothetical protein